MHDDTLTTRHTKQSIGYDEFLTATYWHAQYTGTEFRAPTRQEFDRFIARQVCI